MHRATLETADGFFLASFTDRGLASLQFPGQFDLSIELSPRPLSRDVPEALAKWVESTSIALHEALPGHTPAELPPFDWTGRTEFQRAVWSAMLRIRPGSTRTYTELAMDAGHPKALRAVGSACGANPIPVLVPCHRVLASGGGIGGFSAGLEWKRLLLAREGVQILNDRSRATLEPELNFAEPPSR